MGAIAATLGYISFTQSLGIALVKSDPDRAYFFAASDGRIGALLARKRLIEDQARPARKTAVRMARIALDHEPLAVPAVAVLAMDAQLRNQQEAANRLFGYADKLSRRDLSTRLWLIENSVQNNDISAAIRNYDIALRTSPKTFEMLFPILAGAIDNAEIAKPLALTLAQKPIWTEAFTHYLVNSGTDPRKTARFFRLLASQRVPLREVDQAGVVDALAATGSFDQAWAYYEVLRPRVSRERSRDPGFSAQLKVPTAFDWTPRMSDSGIVASIEHTKTKGLFTFSAPTTVGGVVLEQLQLLPPGRYRLDGRSIDLDQAHESAPYWSLICTDGRELGRVNVPNASHNEGRFTGTFAVDATCSAQVLRLILRSSSAVSGVSGQIDNVVLKPL